MSRDEWINEKDLPIKYAGVSSCFRQEVNKIKEKKIIKIKNKAV